MRQLDALPLLDCGIVKINGRITGGKEAYLGQFPWMARLGYEDLRDSNKIKFNCGASLIHPYYVLTAAHCIHELENRIKVVRLGENFADTYEDCENGICAPPFQDIDIEKLIINPKYNFESAKNDIALIHFVRPICLPYGQLLENTYVSQTVEIAGWGLIDSSSEVVSPRLLFVRIPVRDLMNYCVQGVISFGEAFCGESPSVYTNVIPYMDWILNTIHDEEELTALDIFEPTLDILERQ
ncbi:hypothetical protein NQ314_019013 [Rhamnusium bicolor]|uniref:Peptidase S1 domain-containing protein n=1 Tax=Rhamnusium bicolor TaxID=1586634 RepID=A0AAV8WPK0_9CUCU|nr:hypothetical protein NQ314_019013 [Rhamnusium bicolor]